MEQQTTSELAQELGIPETTLRHWVKAFNVPIIKRSGGYRYEEEAIKALRVIKQLREADRGMNTIRQRLCNNAPTMEQQRNKTPTIGGQWNNDTPTTEQQGDNTATIKAVVKEALSEENQLAEKYARATYKIGELDNEVKHLQATIEAIISDKKALEEKFRCLPSPEHWEAIQAKLEARLHPWARLQAWFTGNK